MVSVRIRVRIGIKVRILLRIIIKSLKIETTPILMFKELTQLIETTR